MSQNQMMFRNVLGIAIAGSLVVGCASQPEPLYYWGDYQAVLWEHFNSEVGPEEEILSMEEIREKAQAEGKELPPGFHAHLALLYATTGKGVEVRKGFEAEKTRFPESSAYMDFLLRNLEK